MFSIREFEGEVEHYLRKHSTALTNRLNEMETFKYSHAVKTLHFEIFIEPTRYEMDIQMFKLDKRYREAHVRKGKLDKKYCEVHAQNVKNIFITTSENIAREVPYYLDDNATLHKLIDEKLKSEDHAFFKELETATIRPIIKWFITCWKQSKLKNFALHNYVGFHDDLNSYDLKKGKWIKLKSKFGCGM